MLDLQSFLCNAGKDVSVSEVDSEQPELPALAERNSKCAGGYCRAAVP